MAFQLFYCKKCGRIVMDIPEEFKNPDCDFCASQLYDVPQQYLEDSTTLYLEKKEAFMNAFIFSNPEFSKKLHKKLLEHQEAKEKQWEADRVKEEQNRAAAEYLKTHPGAVICPKCGSVSVTPVQYQSAWTGNGYVENLCMKCGYKWTPGMNF